jgi:5-methylcytosine-specific restriction endonuclease McrA
MVDLPKPEKRRSFTARQRNEVANRQNWRCNYCTRSVYDVAFEIDHIHRLDALGKHEPDNWQALCVPCHAIKTKVDNLEAKKGRRIRGENKPRAKKAIPSRGFSATLRRKMDGTTERK